MTVGDDWGLVDRRVEAPGAKLRGRRISWGRAWRTVSPPPKSHDRSGNVPSWYPLVRTGEVTAPVARSTRSARYVQGLRVE